MTDHDVHVPVDEPARSARRKHGEGRTGLAVTAGIDVPSTAAVAALARALFLHGRTTADPTAHAGVLRIRD